MSTVDHVPIPVKLLLNPIHLLSFGFGSGLSLKMPGTLGTIVGVLIYCGLPAMDWQIYLVVLASGFLVGVFLCGHTAKVLNVHDHSGIVWDEIIGYLFTMFMVPKSWSWILIGFILFRLFDILKPWPISWVDKYVNGGLGIMLDDVIAAFFSLVIIQIMIYLS